ncbi:DNA-binding transcriptional regulator, LysR family [Amphritea atlantica]|uniref:DNA-binding transcriptional regulator, LysR family n=1 Tax=Amphritea atlantica TaxID=355243 RepID=A0A1H9KYB4_9GAMM|nr:LysR family transcriptional regulator [Amphritea atlantica]SER03753.1 DNA-binding transcriptional regulator, LysR family [Amphritea atlantica]
MSLSLRQLRIFEATARLGRLTAAADEQALSQSAASQALKELEVSLGYRLFSRNSRELVITEMGRDILPRVRDILINVERLNTPRGGGISGSFRVAASVTIASYLFAPLMADFIRQYPQVEPDLQIANTRQVIAGLEKGQAHIGLIEGPASHSQLQIIPWRSDELLVFCSQTHPLAQAGHLSVEQMSQQRWILREQGSGTREVFDRALQQVNGNVAMVMALNRQEAIKQSVKAGLGIGCLSRLAVAEELRRGELVVLQTPLQLSRQLSVVVPSDTCSNPLVQAFLHFLQLPEAAPLQTHPVASSAPISR